MRPNLRLVDDFFFKSKPWARASTEARALKIKKSMFKFFTQYPEILAVMSEKKDGQMKFLEKRSAVNRKIFFRKFGLTSENVATAVLCHGKKVVIAKNKKQLVFLEADGLITNQPGIFLSVTVADCLPILFFDPKKKIIGIAHAGWRGVLKNIVPAAVEKIKKLGGQVKNIQVEIGPGIGQCHFEIGQDMIGKFKEYKKFIEDREGKYFVDLKGIVADQLKKAGMKKENIRDAGVCTFCEKKYFSARRDKNKEIQSGVAVIGLVS